MDSFKKIVTELESKNYSKRKIVTFTKKYIPDGENKPTYNT